MTETFEFITRSTVVNQYCIPMDKVKEFLEEEEMDTDNMLSEEIGEYLADNIQEFSDYAVGEPDYEPVEVEVF